MMLASELLRVKDLSFAYDHAEVLTGVDITVGSGEVVCLIGPNGAGKTTLMNVLARLLPQPKGVVEYAGEDITRMPQPEVVRRGLILVPEGRQVFGTLTVEDNLRLGMFTRRKERDFVSSASDVYDLFPRLKERHTQLAGTLSGGEQQMLAIGRALMGRPELMLLDEPSLGLAPKITKTIMHALDELRRSTGLTILLVEQNAMAALDLADRGYVLNGGSVHAEGTSPELRANDMVRRIYLGVES